MLRGHKIETIEDGTTIYSDTKEPTATAFPLRPCGICNKHFTPEGHDPCLGTLIGVKNACCGHGEISGAYIQFWNNDRVAGKAAIELQSALKKALK